ncbi:hypothetical protein ABZ129_28070, partial [Streptomyces sp. NPDC006307]
MAAEVVATALDLLPARLRKRVDGAVAKAADWPVERTADGVLVRAGDDTVVTLTTADGGVVASADAAVCSCLLAPACLHRAAVLSRAPVAEEGPAAAAAAPEKQTAPGPDTSEGASSEPVAAREGGGGLTTVQTAALHALGDAAVTVLVAGVAGAGAVVRAELLRAAHSARLAGLHRPAAVAVRVARRLGEARSEDPAFRLPELSADLAALLDSVQRTDAAALAGPVRRAYRSAQPLRLYGLFTEPVVTASGYAGATVYAVTPDGSVHTVSDVAPGGPERA